MAWPLDVRILTVESWAEVIVSQGGWSAIGQLADRFGNSLYAVCAPTSGTGMDVPSANRTSPRPVVSGRGDALRMQPLV